MSSDYLSKRQSVSDIRRENLRQIMTLLARYKTLTRHEICARTGLTGAGLSRNIRELEPERQRGIRDWHDAVGEP